MSIDWQNILFNFLGGLGLFLYSIKTMGDGLQQAAGDRLRYYIDKYTSNPFLGVLVGIVVTALIQSSTGVTVITVGLVSAGLINATPSNWDHHGGQYRDDGHFLHHWFQVGNICLAHYVCRYSLSLLYQESDS